MPRAVKVAAVQMAPRLLDKEWNLAQCLERVAAAAEQGAELVVLPECALSGYVFDSLEAALPAAEPVPGPSTNRIVEACRQYGVHVVVGLLETDGEACYNTAVLLGPGGLVGKHRKAHLPDVGVDRFVTRGNLPFQVYDTPVGRIGLAICWESCFPEHIRTLVLQGAEIVALATNWPDWTAARMIPEIMVPARAAENSVYVVAADRFGQEGKVRFIGGSRIAGILGVLLAVAREHEEDMILAELDLEKTVSRSAFLQRLRPDLYGLTTGD